MNASNDVIPRVRAREVIRELSIEAPGEIDIEAIACHFGLRVVVGELTTARGRLMSNGREGIIRISDRVPTGGQRRFVIAHELGHHLLHRRKGLTAVCLDSDMLRYEGTGREGEANRFAAELLMPEKLFAPRCDVARPSLVEADRLAREFQTTLTSAAIRFVDLCPEACALVWCENCSIKWFSRGGDFTGWFNVGTRLDSGTCAYDAFAGKAVPDKLEQVSAEAWCEGARVDDVYEHTRYLDKYRATLTLLWARSE
jgi:hypothetical protein